MQFTHVMLVVPGFLKQKCQRWFFSNSVWITAFKHKQLPLKIRDRVENTPKNTPNCEVLGSVISKSYLVLYPGHLEGTVHVRERYLVKILLKTGKKVITKKWLKSEAPSHKQWLSIKDDILYL